jgi:hypothetical protein
MMTTTTEPRLSNIPPQHLSHWEATRLAKASGAKDLDTLVTYLMPCRDLADADNSIAQLRRNQPQLFLRKGGR